jgi:phosphatidate phosphatase APP1
MRISIPFFILAAFIVAIAFPAGKANSTNERRLIVICDLDDTMVHAQIRAPSHLPLIINGLRNDMAFTGSGELLRSLAGRGAEIHYVTGRVQPFLLLTKSLLKAGGYPAGALYLKPVGTKTPAFKKARITEIMSANPEAEFVFIGDNGQWDASIYEEIRTTHPQGKNIRLIAIHEIYGEPYAHEVVAGQKLFVTMAGLALELRDAGLLGDDVALGLLEQTDRGFSSPHRMTNELTWPSFANVNEQAVTEFYSRAERETNPAIQSAILSVVGHLHERYTRSCRAAIGS